MVIRNSQPYSIFHYVITTLSVDTGIQGVFSTFFDNDLELKIGYPSVIDKTCHVII